MVELCSRALWLPLVCYQEIALLQRFSNSLRRSSSVFRLTLLTVCICAFSVLAACQGDEPNAVEVEGGDPERGAELVQSYDCVSCHYIPGVEGPHGTNAPGLQLWKNRSFVAGAAPNRPENVIAFLMDPESIQPGSAMPNLGLSEEEARHITAYLFTLGAPE
jgi:cytochrome c